MATISNQTTPRDRTRPRTVQYQRLPAAPPFASRAPGLTFDRHFTRPGISPFDEIVWELRDAVIQDFKGKIIFEQKNVEVPADWSMTATNIVASKYLHGQIGTSERESGVRALITRVAESIRDWGIAGGYFATPQDAETFYAELAHLLLNQKVAFNSPVWFNVGCDRLEPNSDAQNWHWNPTAARSSSPSPAIASRSARPASSTRSTTRSTPSSPSPRPRACSSSGVRAPAPTSRASAAPWRPSPAAAPHPARSQLHARLRRLRRRHQVRRQNPPRRQDGHPQRRPSRHRRLHRVQSEGRAEGVAPDAGRLRRLRPRLRGLQLHLLPERQQLRPRHRRVHGRRRSRRPPSPPAPSSTARPSRSTSARDIMHKIAEATWQCGDPGMQYDTTINRWHTSKNSAPHQRLQSLLGVHVPRRLRLQPCILQSPEVPHSGRPVRHRRATVTPSASSPRRWRSSSTPPATPPR